MKNKLTIGIVSAFILLLLIFLVYVIIAMRSSDARYPQGTGSTAPSSIQLTASVAQDLSVFPTPQSVAMGTESFVIHIPNEWSAEQDGYASGESVLIKPVANKEEIPEKSMRIVIERNTTASRMNQLQKSYELKQYRSQTVSMFENQATKYIGYILAPTESGMVPVQETVYMIQRDTTLYLILYHYFGSERNESFDYEFETMISTLELK